jgi:hypothetical protein
MKLFKVIMKNVIILALELLSIMRSLQSSIQHTESVLLSKPNVLIRFAVTITQSYSDKEVHSEFGDSGRENTLADNIVETIL